jgi:uncharacterized protein (TIGR04222 family)
MNRTQLDLWQRIEAFDIDGPEPLTFSFGARLARENGWTRIYAERVIREYKRFVFLAMISPTHVTPSEEIDQAWHLHMIYSRSYWERFCRDLLQRPLHHEPTRGGTDEHDKHLRQYQETLQLYRTIFGQKPPQDIWPSPEARFQADSEGIRIDRSHYWLIPKPNRLVKAGGIAIAVAGLAVLSIGCAGWNPFAMKGTDFLSYFIPALLLAMFSGMIIRILMSRVESPPADDPRTFSWEETAYLTGEKNGLTLAALSRMIQNGSAVYEPSVNQIDRGPHGDRAETVIEQKIWRHLPISQRNKYSLTQLAEEVEATFAPSESRLQERGYLLSQDQARTAAIYSIVPLCTLLLFIGLPRCFQGVANGKPTSVLFATIAFGVLIAWINFAFRRRPTRAAMKIIDQVRSNSLSLRDRKNWSSPDQTALAVALFGGGVLAGSHIASLRQWYGSNANGSNSSSGCSSGDGGGGGGGCGGCGGGD